jgi:hypothetical protein
MATSNLNFEALAASAPELVPIVHPPSNPQLCEDVSDDALSEFEDENWEFINASEHEANRLKMHESHSQANQKSGEIF